jgi:uncharacterized protein YecE (DUF72 family)
VKVFVGTSGWSYPEWKGSFYPPKIRTRDMLSFYTGHFPAVEVNNSFYRIPTERVLAQWAEQVPEDFRFIMKASRRITHFNRLGEVDGSLRYFLRAVNPLGPRLGPTLFQLPPTLEKDPTKLREFLARLPARWPAALEVRHPSWFDNEVYRLLEGRNVPLVAVDVNEELSDLIGSPLVPTAGWGYVRLRRGDYTVPELEAWARRILAQPWAEAYVFLKHEEGSPVGPGAATRLQGILEGSGA